MRKSIKRRRPSARDAKERNHLDLAREMLLRGFHFLPPDLEKSHVRHFLIEDGALRMPLMSVAGLGESAAISVVEARKESPLQDGRGHSRENQAQQLDHRKAARGGCAPSKFPRAHRFRCSI